MILLIYILITDSPGIGKRDLMQVIGIGVVNVVASMSLLQLSLYVSNAKASVVAVIFSSNPIFVTVFSALLDKERINLRKILGLIAGVIGIIVIFIQKIDFKSLDLLSPALALLSSVLFGLYTVLGRKITMRIGSVKMNSYSFISGSLILLPLMLAFKIPVFSFDYSGIPQVAFLAVFVTGFAYLTYFKGLSITGAGTGSMVFFAKPALASILAVLFLHEHMTASLVAGIILIISGIAVSVYPGRSIDS